MIPLKVDYKDFDVRPNLNNLIEEQTQKLEKYFERITSCHVVVSRPHQRHLSGNVCHVHIDLHVPGSVIAVTREPEKDERHDEPALAVRDAFRIAKRQLSQYSARMRSEVKIHERPQELGNEI